MDIVRFATGTHKVFADRFVVLYVFENACDIRWLYDTLPYYIPRIKRSHELYRNMVVAITLRADTKVGLQSHALRRLSLIITSCRHTTNTCQSLPCSTLWNGTSIKTKSFL